MKHAGHVLAVIAVALVCTASVSPACDHEKSSAAAASTKSTKTTQTKKTVTMAASYEGKTCTVEQMAACQAGAATATTAAHQGCEATGVKTTAMATSASGCCASKGAATATAVTASSSPSKVNAMAAGSGSSHSCGAKDAEFGAMAAGSGGSCSGHGMAKAAGQTAHADCDACADMSACGAELTAAQAHTQIVPLKNGVMFVYTADSPSQITAVQSAMARRGERMAQFVSAGEKARLCSECKSLRTAMASGKLTREVVNIEGGALTLMTSNDPAVVAKIHAMVDIKASSRTKS